MINVVIGVVHGYLKCDFSGVVFSWQMKGYLQHMIQGSIGGSLNQGCTVTLFT